jgi:dsRNA-specific ribonuclease
MNLCYQRLEFLGDAIFDLLISKYLFSLSPSLSPGEITNWRSYVACNQFLGSLSVQLGLYKVLQHSSQALQVDIDAFAHSIETSSVMNAPKVLGDLFEAIIGAIFIDSSGNIDLIFSIVQNIVIDPILNPLMMKSRQSANLSNDITENLNKTLGVEINAISAYYEIKNLLACSEMYLLFNFDAEFDDEGHHESMHSLYDFNHLNKPTVSCKVLFHNEIIAIGDGRNKKQAKESACAALVGIDGDDRNSCYRKLKLACKCVRDNAG